MVNTNKRRNTYFFSQEDQMSRRDRLDAEGGERASLLSSDLIICSSECRLRLISKSPPPLLSFLPEEEEEVFSGTDYPATPHCYLHISCTISRVYKPPPPPPSPPPPSQSSIYVVFEYPRVSKYPRIPEALSHEGYEITAKPVPRRNHSLLSSPKTLPVYLVPHRRPQTTAGLEIA